MASILPEGCHFCLTGVISQLELDCKRLPADEVVRLHTEDLARQLVERMLRERTTVETTQRDDNSASGAGQVIVRVHGYLFSEEQLEKLIADARMQGQRDAERFRRSSNY